MKKWQLLGTASVLALTLAACGNDDKSTSDGDNTAVESPDKENTSSTNSNNDSNDNDDNNDDNSSTAVDKRAVKDAPLALDEALATFDETYKGAKISSIELDESNRQFTYDIEGFDDKKEYSVEIGEDNNVIEKNEENRDKGDDYQELMRDEYITPEEAIDKASKASEVGDLAATSWSLDYDDDEKAAVYQVKFENTKDEVEVTLDAKTGDQLNVEKD